jgi:hypothetical protein
MNILNEIKKQKGCFVNVENQNNLINAVNRLRKTNFDPKQFDTQNRPDGMFVHIRNAGTSASGTPEYHFQGEVTKSNCAGAGGELIIHGGLSTRKTNNQIYKIPLECDSGPSEHYEDYYTVTGITESKYVWAELNDPLKPTALTISNDPSFPDDDENKYTCFVLGFANVTSDVLTWEPYREMDLIPDAPVIPDSAMDTPDCRSIEFRNNDGRAQLLDFEHAPDQTLLGVDDDGATIDLVYRLTNVAAVTCSALTSNSSGGAKSYSRSDHTHNITSAGTAGHADTADHADYADDAEHATWADFANASSIAKTHSTLEDIVAGSCGDDHGDAFPGNFVYLARSGDYARNACEYIGSSGGMPRISLNTCELWRDINATEAPFLDWDELRLLKYTEAGTVRSVDWDNHTLCGDDSDDQQFVAWTSGLLLDGAGNTQLDWILAELNGNCWSVTGIADITLENAASGNFRCAGGVSIEKKLQAKAFYLLEDSDNVWDTSSFSTNVASVNLTTSGDLNLTISGLKVNGAHAGLDVADGSLYLCNSSSVAIQQVFVRDGFLCTS